MLTLLWSDYFIYALVFISVVFLIKNYQKKENKMIWQKILYRPINILSLMILGFYIAIGVLDTVHFRESNGIASLLDKMLAPLIVQTEKTYSAPFATHSFVKETIVSKEALILRDYPRLVYGGKHLIHTQDKSQDIVDRSVTLFMISSLLWLGCAVLLIIMLSRYHKIPPQVFCLALVKGKTAMPWRTFLATLFFLVLFGTAVYQFMGYYHILGTNQVGEDVLYQTLKSIRTGLVIGILTTIITLPFALSLGMLSGFYRGWCDDVIQFLYTTLSSIPGVLLIAAFVLTLQVIMARHSEWFETISHRSDARLLALCAILGITSWTQLCRLIRAETLKIMSLDYISAARCLGLTDISIMLKHILPNVFHLILIMVVLDFSGLVLAEAVLSYVGVGVDPSSYSWGTMINSARLELARVPAVWWSLSAAFVFMFTLVLAANIVSDALRDALDPRQYRNA